MALRLQWRVRVGFSPNFALSPISGAPQNDSIKLLTTYISHEARGHLAEGDNGVTLKGGRCDFRDATPSVSFQYNRARKEAKAILNAPAQRGGTAPTLLRHFSDVSPTRPLQAVWHGVDTNGRGQINQP